MDYIIDTLPNNYIIYQDKDQNNYTQDSLLLFNFININKNCEKILELCCGNGIISLLLSEKTNKEILALDIQPKNITLFNHSIKANNITNIITKELDINGVHKSIGANMYDLIICNPPYFKIPNKDHKTNQLTSYSIARHELCLTFEALVKEVKTLISNKGKFVFIHLVSRYNEIIKILLANNLNIYKIQFIYTNNNEASRMIIECGKSKNTHTKILYPIFIK